jgi:hypothetical protein
MMGSSIKVDLVFSQGKKQKEVRFPPNSSWVDLNTMEPIIAPAGGKYFSIMVDAGVTNPVNMFQKTSTIVSLQDAQTYQVKKVQDLLNTPLHLSVALDEFNEASGYVTVEQYAGNSWSIDTYSIRTDHGGKGGVRFFFDLVGDKNATVTTSKMTLIEKITVSYVKYPWTNAAALFTDGSSMELYVSTYNYSTRKQVTIMPQYLPDPDRPAQLDMKKGL